MKKIKLYYLLTVMLAEILIAGYALLAGKKIIVYGKIEAISQIDGKHYVTFEGKNYPYFKPMYNQMHRLGILPENATHSRGLLVGIYPELGLPCFLVCEPLNMMLIQVALWVTVNSIFAPLVLIGWLLIFLFSPPKKAWE